MGVKLKEDDCYVPPLEELDDADAIGGNRQYLDLRFATWDEVRGYIEAERYLLTTLKGAPDEREAVLRFLMSDLEDDAELPPDDEIFEAIGEDFLLDVDPGVASAVCALSALGCVPFSSCNGGEFARGEHPEVHPVVAFYAGPGSSAAINAAVDRSGVELTGCPMPYEAWIIHAEKVSQLIDFAEALLESHTAA